VNAYRAAREQGRDVQFGRTSFHFAEPEPEVPPSPARVAVLRRQEERFVWMERKYRRAARCPWLPVPPDPPEPE
jgi:hypothetical protein